MICCICHKPISEDEQYACVWIEGKTKLSVSFAHLGCTDGMEDVTEEVTGKKEAQ